MLPAYRGAPLQRGYGLGGIFKGLVRTFKPIVKKGLVSAGKQALLKGIDVLNDVSESENSLKNNRKRNLDLQSEELESWSQDTNWSQFETDIEETRALKPRRQKRKKTLL